MSRGTSAAVTPTETVPADARVRHFDQLDDRAQEFVLSAGPERTIPPAVPNLEPGDVVVFTEYYYVR